MTDRSARARVLIGCVRDPLDPQTALELRASLAGVTDWAELADAALLRNMSGLLYRRVSDLCPDAVPPVVLQAWRSRSADVAVSSLRMQRYLVAVLHRLSAAGVPALAFKGAVISEQLYGDSTVRLCVDSDILVHPASVRVARDVVIGMGYDDVYPLDTWIERLQDIQDAEQEIGFRQPVTGALLEVHWRIGPRFEENSLSAEALFERASEVELLGRSCPCLGSLDVVLALSVHAATHQWLRIEDVASLRAALAGLDDLAARELETMAHANGCLRRLRVGLLLVESLAQMSLPVNLRESARSDNIARRLASVAEAHLVASLDDASESDASGPSGRALGALWEARCLDSLRASVRYACRRLFVPALRDRRSNAGPGRGRLGALTTQVRRQERLWRRSGD